jgi:glyoxylase-like metal-dependent hydrolase (beta-lactamase superfamily II)
MKDRTGVGDVVQVGDLQVLPVFDGSVDLAPSGMYRFGPDAMKGGDDDDWAPHRDLLADDGALELVFGGFLVRGAGDRLLLVDGGVGREPHGTGVTGGHLLDSLAGAGVAPGDVTDVLFTHLHFDHIGWATVDGAPTFPRATYRCHRRDWDHFYGTDDDATARLTGIEPQLELFDADTTLAPGIDTRLAPGHTPGSTLVVLSSGDERALLLGDVVHCAVELVDDDWGGVFDVDPALAQRTRNALARELEGTDVPVAGAHFPGLRFGRVLPGQGTRRFVFG